MADNTLDRVTWWELPAPDLEQSKAFYAAVFGWTYEPFDEHAMIHTPDGEMVGALDGSATGRPGDGIAGYVNVADLEDAQALVVAGGGEVVQARTEIGGDMGWWAAFRDPTGLRVGLCTDQPAA
ncbi:MAG: hypothetical protein GEV07_08325 [Streptosporangiales bacterium]|nr:hypothetical protein [Streptosporangiales bacterium]